MTESHDTRGALTLVAIDIAKGCHEVLVLPPAPARRRRFQMADGIERDARSAGWLLDEAVRCELVSRLGIP